jgi:rod shape-determining protein MreB and related proteins
LSGPSVVAIHENSKTGARKILSVGNEAKRMLGRTPGKIIATRPLREGVIADFTVTEAMLGHLIRKVHKRQLFYSPQIIVCVPFAATPVERRAVRDAAERVGARKVFLIEGPMAAAIGAGQPVTEDSGSMVIDIGGGITEVAIISLAEIVASRSIRVGGDKMDEAIIAHVRRKYSLLIDEGTAENIKIQVGSAFPLNERKTIEIKGRDLINGVPKYQIISDPEILKAMSEPINAIVEAVRFTLKRTPPELEADIVDRGIVLTGGGALLRGLDHLLAEETGLPVVVAEDPLSCVVMGAGRALEELDGMSDILMDK